MNTSKTYKGFWKHMWKYVKSYKANIIITAICSLIVGVCVAFQPLIIKFIVDNGISSSSLAAAEKISFVGILCLVYVGLSVLRVLIWRTGLINMLNSLEGSVFKLRSEFFSHVQHMCMKFYDTTSVGELFNCIMGSPIINIKTYMQQIFINIPYQAVSFIISVSALVYYDWLLTVILLATAFVMAAVTHVSRQRVRNTFADYIKAESEASHYLNDTLHGMDAIKLYSIEDKTFGTFRRFIDDMYKKGVKATVTQATEYQKPELVQYIGIAVVYFVGAVSCIYRGLSVGVLYAFISSMGTILTTFNSWLNIGLQKSSAEAGLYRILSVLDTHSTTPEIPEERTRSVEVEKESAIHNGKPCIEFDNVTFAYDNKEIFNSFDCAVKYNESVALVGGSGSGKSTFTKLVMRLYDVQSGSVRVHGRDVRDFNMHDLRVTFGVVPQNPFIFSGTIWDNVRIARPGATNKEVIHAMEIAHVHEFVDDLDDGWNTVVGDGALGLSGGQKQRIAIARAVLGNPDILIFDEATSALDNISEKHIQEAMETLMKTHTVIIVAHRLSTIRNVDRILVFDHGRVVEEGSYDELLKNDGAFKKLLTLN